MTNAFMFYALILTSMCRFNENRIASIKRPCVTFKTEGYRVCFRIVFSLNLVDVLLKTMQNK